MSTRNFYIATHMGDAHVELPAQPPTNNNMVLVANVPLTSTAPITTTWKDMAAASGGIPAATEDNQILVSGPGPSFDWAPQDLDQGRY